MPSMFVMTPAHPMSRGVRLLLAAFLMLALPSCGADTVKHADDANIRAFLDRYFATWSAKDMG